MHPFLNTALKAARNAANIVMRSYSRPDRLKISSKKSAYDYVTDIDRAAEREIVHILSTAYPRHGFLCEESGSKKGDNYTWIIDPIDGTANFIHGIPHFSISIALKYQNNIEHGLIYDPVRDDLFTASRGEGAFKNNHRIRVSRQHDFSHSILATNISCHKLNGQAEFFNSFEKIVTKCLSIRSTGSAALNLAYIAAGHFEGVWDFNLSVWDIAAGILIVREAGGLVSDLSGGETYLKTGNIIAANPKIFKQMLSYFRSKV